MLVYKYEYKVFEGGNDCWDKNVVNSKYVLNNTERNRKIFCQESKAYSDSFIKNGLDVDECFRVTEIDVSDY